MDNPTIQSETGHENKYYKGARKSFTPDEKLVIDKKFPWVLTNTLKDGKGLHEHFHHSNNTYYIVSGSLEIGRAADGIFRLRLYHGSPGDWIDMPRNVKYMAGVEDAGCTFVEGRELLSPSTAKRFLGNGTFVEASEGEKGSFTTVGQ